METRISFSTILLKGKGGKHNATAHDLHRLPENFFLYLSYATVGGDVFCNWKSTTFLWHFLLSMTWSPVMHAALNYKRLNKTLKIFRHYQILGNVTLMAAESKQLGHFQWKEKIICPFWNIPRHLCFPYLTLFLPEADRHLTMLISDRVLIHFGFDQFSMALSYPYWDGVMFFSKRADADSCWALPKRSKKSKHSQFSWTAAWKFPSDSYCFVIVVSWPQLAGNPWPNCSITLPQWDGRQNWKGKTEKVQRLRWRQFNKGGKTVQHTNP